MQVLGHADFSMEEALLNLDEFGDMQLVNVLPPLDPIGWIEHEWYGDCNGSHDPAAEYAALLVVQRAWDDILIPIYDMMSHRNGHWLNTESNEGGVHSGEPVRVQASRDIKAGEQIYTSYNMCEDCAARVETYGTSEIFRDYGFIEQFPQSWIFNDLDLGFRVDVADEDAKDYQGVTVADADNDNDDDGNKLYVLTEWIDGEPDYEDIRAINKKLEYIIHQKKLLADRKKHKDVPDHEWNQMVKYMDSMELGIKVALQWDKAKSGNHACVIDGTCTVDFDRYTDLDETYKTTNEEYYSHKTCDINTQFRVFDDGTFDEIDSFKSQYQQINFLYNPLDRDTCMDLDDTVQICDAYRPHYHEYAVHQTARFLPKDSIKRVLFVGGGDSMLLHETLKYPSLELVVGLELDQKVTRGCFKHFGTQPHFHDERVEWWFGDAAKSLLMLPKDYFASFDLVLVDLSETVMSFKVTEELDVIEALTLLVKPDGIFVKNEVYFEKFKEMFPYSAQVNWYDNPIICSQVMVMGSRTVDFMNNPTLTEHGTDNLVVTDLENIEDNFELYHDYAYNATSFHLCDSLADKKNDETQVRSPGIMLVVEAEDVTGDLSGDGLQANLASALEKEGFKVVASDSVQTDGSSNAIATIILNEGYIIARAMADSNYVGFDIHFWSAMHKHVAAKDALVAAVGGNVDSLSSYRVIAGGMFGIDTWEEDLKLRGPQFEEMCRDIIDTAPTVNTNEGDVNEADVTIVMEESLKLLESDDLKVVMLVGNEDSTKIVAEKNRATVAGFDKVKEVITMNCPSMVDFNEFSEEAGDALTACEKHLHDFFKESTNDEVEFDAIIVDSTADKITSSIMLKMFGSRRMKIVDETLSDDVIVITTIVDKKDEAWKRNLMLLFKDEVFVDAPAAFTEVLFENSKSKSEFSLLVTNDGGERFIGNLNATLVEFNKDDSNHLTGRVQVINGGDWLYQDNFSPSRTYLPDDYDQTGPLAQWESQMPTGHQFILQMEPNPSSKKQIKVTENLLMKATLAAIKKAGLEGLEASAIKTFSDMGEGSLLVALWDGGSLAVLWDGRTHVDVNLFTYVESISIGDLFGTEFLRSIPTYAIMLRDEQPRGTGKIVSYQRDLDDTDEPHWA